MSKSDLLVYFLYFAVVVIVIGVNCIRYIEKRRKEVFDNRRVIIANISRLLSRDNSSQIPLSIEKWKIIKKNLTDINELEKKLNYPDCPSIEMSAKDQIVSMLNECTGLLMNAGVPHSRLHNRVYTGSEVLWHSRTGQ